MQLYRYTARDSKGAEVSGEQEGADSTAVATLLQQRGLLPIRIELKREAVQFDWRALLQRKIPLDELVIFSRQMYALTKAGIPILRAISGLAESSHSRLMRETLTDVVEQLEAGRTLSTAMSAHPRVFERIYTSMIHVGENTGRLDESFLQLATYLEEEQETRRRIKSAMRYPSFVLLFIVAALVVVNIWVIPKFASLFSRFGADLPWATKLLIASSNLFLNYWVVMLLGVIGGVIGFKAWLATDNGRRRWDHWKLRFLIIGPLINLATLSRYCRSFSVMLRSGIPMPHALTLVSQAVDNFYMAEKIQQMRTAIERGETLYRASRRSELFTPLVMQMVAVGEETGRIDVLLLEAAEFYEREVDFDLKSLTARIEPLLLIIVAVMVLILALGIFTPMWDMMRVVKGG